MALIGGSGKRRQDSIDGGGESSGLGILGVAHHNHGVSLARVDNESSSRLFLSAIVEYFEPVVLLADEESKSDLSVFS